MRQRQVTIVVWVVFAVIILACALFAAALS
jgi:hypothetical protein